jgi:DNA-binding transcriptional MerR regulator
LDKAPDAFRTISEVADEIDVPQHVLRFWESRFQQIRPMKRGGGRRYYRPDDVSLLRGVRHLLYGQGYTIRGVQRILREQGAAFVQDVWRAGAELPPPELEEDRAGDTAAATIGEAPPVSRPEPNLFAVSLPRAPAHSAPSGERREPTLVPPAVLDPPARRGVAADDRRKLQSALDELVACRGIIETALRQG